MKTIQPLTPEQFRPLCDPGVFPFQSYVSSYDKEKTAQKGGH